MTADVPGPDDRDVDDRGVDDRGVDDRGVGRFLDAVVSITSELDLDEVLTRIVDGAMAITGARYGALGVSDGRRLVRFMARGVTDDQIAAIDHWPRGEGLLGLLLHEARPLRVADMRTHPAAVGLPPGHPPMRSFLGVPILVRDEVYGDLYLAEKNGGAPFTADDERTTSALAAAAGSAIDNARLMAESRRSAVERDRERIAADLHDVVVQRLFASGLSLMAVLRSVPDEATRRGIEHVVDDLDETVEEIRNTIADLRRPDPGSPIGARVRGVVATSSAGLGFAATVEVDESPGVADASLRTGGSPVPEEVADQVVVVLGEALANVARHAAARSAHVRLRVRPSDLELVVDDDGRGIDDVLPRRSGLANLERRARALHGSLVVVRRAEGGTRLRWTARWAGASPGD